MESNNYLHPPPPNPAHLPPISHSLLLILLTPLMSIFSELSLTNAPPTFVPLFPSLSSVCRRRYRRFVRGGGSSSPFSPVPARHRPYLVDRRGGEEVSLDSAEEAERFVGWGCKVSLMDLQ